MFLSRKRYEKILVSTLRLTFCASAKILFSSFVRGVARDSGLVAYA